MGEHHHHQHDLQGRSLVITIFLNIAITVAQVFGAIISHSLSLLSDALHNFSDVMALLISYIANKLSKRKYTKDKSFGYKRAEIIAAFINAATLLALSVYLIVESIERFVAGNQAMVNGTVVAILAGFSILANGISVLVVKKHSEHSMNMRSAYLHLFSDMLSSVAVLLAGLAMKYWGVTWIDSALSIAIAVYLIVSAWSLFVKTVRVLMQFTPSGLDITEIASYVEQREEVNNLHHVHVWQLTDHEIHLEGHIDFVNDICISESNKLIEEIAMDLKTNFHIGHCTFQAEFNVDHDKSIVGGSHECGC